ncbi:MAG: glycosyltransferase family 4 protein [Anaerolineaceae bacterium]|nr:glycosyltransferase family 4 protein [Anaerolineaceae bacterium]
MIEISENFSVLLVHNLYLIRGGEDECFDAEKNLLSSNGVNVIEYVEDNKIIKHIGLIKTAIQTIWSFTTVKNLKKILQRNKIDIIHVHNFFPIISPSVFYAAKHAKIPIVFTVHNQRLFCANGYFLRNQQICELCSNKFFNLPAVRYRCYRNSFFGSLIVSIMQGVHKWISTWNSKVDIFIALTDFSRSKLIQNGIKEKLIKVKPNFVIDEFSQFNFKGTYALFIGRLSEEKGVNILLEAWAELENDISLKIIGDGNLSETVDFFCKNHPSVEWLGRQSHDFVMEILSQAKVLIVPSICYEGMPRAIIEAFSLGKPVIASRIGGIENMISEEVGYLVNPGDKNALVNEVREFLENKDLVIKKSYAARNEYLNKYTPEKNFDLIMDIYQKAIRKDN